MALKEYSQIQHSLTLLENKNENLAFGQRIKKNYNRDPYWTHST